MSETKLRPSRPYRVTSLTDRLHTYSGQALLVCNAVYRFFFTKRRGWNTFLSVSIIGCFQGFQIDLLAHTRKPLYTLFLNHFLQNLQIRELCRMGISYINCYTLWAITRHTPALSFINFFQELAIGSFFFPNFWIIYPYFLCTKPTLH